MAESMQMEIKVLRCVEFFYGKPCLAGELAKQAGIGFIMLGTDKEGRI